MLHGGISWGRKAVNTGRMLGPGSWVREREGASAGVRRGERESRDWKVSPDGLLTLSLLDSIRRMKELLPYVLKRHVTLNVFSLININ